ncbi:MAG: anthranilate phosphoribosyltransferase [Candidatus Korarchaeum sp.]
MIREAIKKLISGQDLTQDEAYASMREVMSGEATSAQIAAFLTALRIKGETVDEIVSFATVMREFCLKITPKVRGRLIDTCGTGGDKVKTFNVSTAAAFIVAGVGIPVAKHCNRSITSKSGSADVLEYLGLNLEAPQDVVQRAIERTGIGFLFAPSFHPAMRNASGPRREIGIRTVFNILGPLTNPAPLDAQVVGVCDAGLVEKVASALKRLGIREAMVVHGLDGLDEISNIGKTSISWLKGGEIRTFEVSPEDLGVKRCPPERLVCSNIQESAEVIFKILYGCLRAGDPRRDLVVINAAAGIIVGGESDEFTHGIELAQESIESGRAYEKLKEVLRTYEGSDIGRLEELEEKYR